jgi:3-oxoacyl-[acyl-carrier-protein] synthase-3
MRYQNVCLESLAYTLPEEVLTSGEIERRLEPVYRRLRLPEGRLELITGIRERRIWARGTRPSDMSILSGQRALAVAGIELGQVGAIIHGSVCRDQLEPATACRVHHHLGLPEACLAYDVSNACLGMLNGLVNIANLIELGQIQAGLVVGTEDSRPLLEGTIAELNRDESLTRDDIKMAVASLTIGSGSAAILLTHRDISRTGNRISAIAGRAHSQHYRLCEGDHRPGAGETMLMQTDSERLLAEGIGTGVATFNDLVGQVGWQPESIHRSICHQVGGAHRKRMLESLGLDLQRDFATYPWLGNTGSVALPTALALAAEQRFLQPGERVAMLGIGSGINCLMVAMEWQTAAKVGTCSPAARQPKATEKVSAGVNVMSP